MRQEHNQAHRTPPVPHSGSLCAPSYRVPKPRFSAPETVRGLRGKKNSVCYWPESSRSGFPTGSGSLGSSLLLLRAGRRMCCFLLGCAFRVLPSCGHGKPLCLMLLSQGLPFVRRVCGAVRRRITSKRPALCIISVHRHVIGFLMSRRSGGRSSNTLALQLRLGAAFLFVLYSLRRTRFILACAAGGCEIGVALHAKQRQQQTNAIFPSTLFLVVFNHML